MSHVIMAQDYHPFPMSNAVWREYRMYASSSSSTFYNYQHELIGDTLLNGVLYSKVHKTGYFAKVGGGEEKWNKVYVGAIREDSSKKVFFIPNSSSVEWLLYDFNLSIGDTLPYMYGMSPGDHIVNIVDSVLLSDTFHKRYGIRVYDSPVGQKNLYFIEGVGTTYGLLQKQGGISGMIAKLICFIHNGITAYSTGEKCELIELPVDNVDTNELKCFLNPSNMIVELTGLPGNQLIFNLYSANGSKVYEKIIPSGKKSVFVDMKMLSPGIYLLVLYDEKNPLLSQKLILQ